MTTGRHDIDMVDMARRLAIVERRLADSERALRRAQATIAMLNDRLAWSEAELAALAAPQPPRCELRPVQPFEH